MPFQSPFNAIRNQFRVPRRLLTETKAQDALSGSLTVAQFQFNAAQYPSGTVFRLGVTFHVSDGSLTGTVLLYNLTDAEVVTNSTFTTSSTTPDSQVSSALIVGAAAGNLKTSAKTYEVRISVTGASPVDVVTVGSLELVTL
jgi:hypothetical protein